MNTNSAKNKTKAFFYILLLNIQDGRKFLFSFLVILSFYFYMNFVTHEQHILKALLAVSSGIFGYFIASRVTYLDIESKNISREKLLKNFSQKSYRHEYINKNDILFTLIVLPEWLLFKSQNVRVTFYKEKIRIIGPTLKLSRINKSLMA